MLPSMTPQTPDDPMARLLSYLTPQAPVVKPNTPPLVGDPSAQQPQPGAMPGQQQQGGDLSKLMSIGSDVMSSGIGSTILGFFGL